MQETGFIAKSIAQAIDSGSTSLYCVSAHQELAFLDEHYTSFHPETASMPFRGVAKQNADFTLLAKSIA